MPPMHIVVAGGSGFLGRPLVERLLAGGHDVAVLTRDASHVRAGRPLVWDGRTQGPWADEAGRADAVVNLAGEGIADARWTEARKRALVESRLHATGALVEAMRRGATKERVLVNASAVGFYGDRGEEVLDETSSRGSGFLAELVERWEAAAREAEAVARVVLLRFGIVLDREGGALGRMLLPFRLGVGGPIGNGRQWMSWIAREDVVRMVVWAVERGDVRGVFNATAPQPVTNREFSRALGRALNRPAVLPVPPLALRTMFGAMADEALLAGQRVLPRRAEAAGFRWESVSIESGLGRALSR
jgi:uncharacterized protein (TIGR01777 family)